MRSALLTTTCAVLSALLFAACSGGGADHGEVQAVVKPPQLDGVVLDVDGETALVAGIALQLEETGETAVSDAAGTFTFLDVPEGDLTVSLTNASASFLRVREFEADRADRTCDRQSDAVRIWRVKSGERIRVEVRIEEKRIVEARVVRENDGKRELELEMRRTPQNTDPDMEGEVELAIDAAGCQMFEVEVENADPKDTLVAVVIHPGNDEEDRLGIRTVEPDGDAEWRLNTCNGDDLPFGVDSLLDLEGYGVEVRDREGTPLLRARIPDLPPYGNCFRVRGAARLRSWVDPIGGYVRYRVVGCVPTWLRQRFVLAAHGLDAWQEVEFFLEDPDHPGTLVSIGTLLANKRGQARLVFDTRLGDDLPHDVATIKPLIGMQIQVRDDVTGELLLSGRVPQPLED